MLKYIFYILFFLILETDDGFPSSGKRRRGRDKLNNGIEENNSEDFGSFGSQKTVGML